MLRYGDGTPFPFTENVLATLEDAVSTCAEMFNAATELDRQREDARAARRVVEGEAKKLVQLESSIMAATADARGANDSVAQRAARNAVAQTQRAIRDAQRELDQIAAKKAADPAWEPLAENVNAAAARFFEKQSLPNTAWTWTWDATGDNQRAHADAQGHAAPFQLAFDLDVSPVWRAPVHVKVLGAGIVLQLPVRRMFGTPAAAATKLDAMYLVQASVDATGRNMLIREKATASGGWRIHIPAQGSARCHLVNKDGQIDGPEFELQRDEHLNRLWLAIETEITAMHKNRHAREVILNNQSIAAIADVTVAPRAILDVLGPIIRAIRAHSRGSGELVLKRDVADGVRAELYVARETIVARYADLPLEYKRHFDDAGFGRGHTDIVDIASITKPLPAQRLARGSAPQVPPAVEPRRSFARPDTAPS